MSKKSNPTSQQTSQAIKSGIDVRALLGRYHGVIYTLLTGLGLSVAVFMLFTVIDESSNTDGHTANVMNTSFDTQTIERINQLRPLSEKPRALALPDSGRINPFRD